MATKPTAKPPTTTLATWDEQLAAQAEIAAGMEQSTATGQFFSLKAGVLSWQDAPLPGNQMAVIVLDNIFETVYYEGAYDPDTPQGPVAFAFGRDQSTMTWHKNSSPEFAGKLCAESEVCEWGSADTGRGKAARETRRLALIPAGTFDQTGRLQLIEDAEHYATTAIGFMKLPVTSVKGYAAFVKQIAGALKRPPHGVVTRVKVVPDPKSQFKVVFEPIMSAPNDLMTAIMQRHEEAKATIDFPYQPYDEDVAPPKRGARAAQPKRGARKY
jgi:hypothetical protein